MERTILVVEDSRTQAERLRLLLEDKGYRVELAADGREGLERVRVAPPDLIISDVVMPEMDGYAFCRAVKSTEALRRIPFVLLTERNTPGDVFKGFEGGADNFITKPFEDEYLLERVARIFENLDLRRQGRLDVEITLNVGGRRVVVNADKQQMIELLFATLEEVTRLNGRLLESQRVVEEYARTLEERVEERTAALRESEVKYRALFEESRDAICIVSRDGRFLDFNQATLDLYGYTSEEMARLNIEDVYVAPGERSRCQQAIDESGFIRDHEVKLRKKDGTEMDCLLTATMRRARDGSPAGYQGIIRDVTERKRLEEQNRQLQKMEAVGRVAGGVAHDFNNLLTVISGRTHLLLNRLEAAGQAREDLVLIQKTSERAAGLVKQLLAFSRKQILEPSVLDLNAVVDSIAPLLGRLIGEDIELAVRPGPGLGRVRADQGQLEQVIMNLAVNARDAMPGGGRLTIEAGNVELDERYARSHVGAAPGSYVMLAVSDNGTGMDADTQAHIFEPFFTTKEEGKGTGLGLSTVYGIVKQSGGNIWVYSEPGQGTSFKIYLPRVEEPADGLAAEAPAAPPPRGSETVLLVEDDDEVRGLAREILDAFGYHVLEARRGDEAVAIAVQHAGVIHLLVTDVVMPGMNGREVAEAVARQRPETKVLYLSGYTENAIVHHGIVDRRTAFLQKPFAPDTLARKVREVLDQGPNRVAGAGPS